MKLLTAFLLLMTLTAQAHVFDCRDGDETETLILEDHSAQIHDLTLINMMDVDHRFEYRGYIFINDPWFDFTIDTKMVDGEAGYARLWAHELQYGQTTLSKFYECVPRQ